jgi:hypothetical protein
LEKVSARHRIGAGVGQHYHAYVAAHARRLLPDCEPLVLRKAVKVFRGASMTEKLNVPDSEALNVAIEAADARPLRILCLYQDTQARARMLAGLEHFLDVVPAECRQVQNRTWVSQGALQWCLAALTQASLDSAEAVSDTLRPLLSDTPGRTVALVETITEPAQWGELRDDKPWLRSALLGLGIASQFIHTGSRPKDKDHPMQNALWDLMRSAGVLPLPVADLKESLPEGTWVVGTFGRKKQGRDPSSGMRIATVALIPGGRKAMAWFGGEWHPLGDAALYYQGNPKPMTPMEARGIADQAIRQLVNSKPGTKVIWMIDGDGCGRLWPTLYDINLGKGSDQPFPGGARDHDISVLRLRTDRTKLPRPAAKGDWSQGGIGKTTGMDGSLLRLAGDREATPWYFVNTPRIMDSAGAHRHGTRFSQRPQVLKEPWHALSPTELLCLNPGPFEPEDLYDLAARLCRRATHWGGVLRRPAPVHLAEALVNDCPDNREIGDEV